ncbi:MAG: SsrA-binding protein SmpB [Lentisphaerae bacterium]|nr:SsrA-binding protein SmpB [Lentisphaerota bacterium]MCP4100308.1 SsrA-binding protein SmpB [Lentisphaerota bacterium]
MGKKKEKKEAGGPLARNKKAFHDYTVLDRCEAGIQLKGTEVKSCRARNISMADSYIKIIRGEAYLVNVHIATYEHGNLFNHDPKRNRKLLLNKKEILKLWQQIKEKGLTLVPLKFYLKHGLIKVEIGLCKGKTHSDKRDTLRKRQDDMDARKAMARL